MTKQRNLEVGWRRNRNLRSPVIGWDNPDYPIMESNWRQFSPANHRWVELRHVLFLQWRPG